MYLRRKKNITVKDNGPGFEPQEQIGEEHVSLDIVRERLHLMCGGTLEIQSSKESRTLVTTIIIPASPNQSSPAVR